MGLMEMKPDPNPWMGQNSLFLLSLDPCPRGEHSKGWKLARKARVASKERKHNEPQCQQHFPMTGDCQGSQLGSVHACVRACVHVYVFMCVRVRVCVCVQVRVHASMR